MDAHARTAFFAHIPCQHRADNHRDAHSPSHRRAADSRGARSPLTSRRSNQFACNARQRSLGDAPPAAANESESSTPETERRFDHLDWLVPIADVLAAISTNAATANTMAVNEVIVAVQTTPLVAKGRAIQRGSSLLAPARPTATAMDAQRQRDSFHSWEREPRSSSTCDYELTSTCRPAATVVFTPDRCDSDSDDDGHAKAEKRAAAHHHYRHTREASRQVVSAKNDTNDDRGTSAARAHTQGRVRSYSSPCPYHCACGEVFRSLMAHNAHKNSTGHASIVCFGCCQGFQAKADLEAHTCCEYSDTTATTTNATNITATSQC